MKKLFYILCIAAVIVIIGVLAYQRIVRQRTQVIPQNAQTIIPVVPQLHQQEASVSEVIPENIMQSGITLLSDEVLVEDIQADLNGDNKEDKIIAAKKLSDQFIYLFIFLQDKTLAHSPYINTQRLTLSPKTLRAAVWLKERVKNEIKLVINAQNIP